MYCLRLHVIDCTFFCIDFKRVCQVLSVLVYASFIKVSLIKIIFLSDLLQGRETTE